MGRFQRTLNDAKAAQQKMADVFNKEGGGSVLSDMVDTVQSPLCENKDVLTRPLASGGTR